MKHNIIFLDIDGVLNSIQSITKNYEIWKKDKRKRKNTDFPTKEYIDRLLKLIKETNSLIVLSSCWRLSKNIKQEFKKMGIPLNLYIGNTPYLCGSIRGTEIKRWIKNNWNNELYENFVILDDDSDMGDLSDYLVKTENKYGLQDFHIEKAKKILLKKIE